MMGQQNSQGGKGLVVADKHYVPVKALVQKHDYY